MLQKTAQQLYDWLIRPLESELANIHHLAFSLDRGLRYIPMEVLHDGEKYLIEKYTVTTFISAQFTDTEDRLPINPNDTLILGMGASEVPGYKPLPHVVTEIDNIVRDDRANDAKGIYPGAKFLEKDFIWDNLWTNLEDKKLLHIATHGEFVPSSQDASFLVLGDGQKLTIEEIRILDDYLDNVHLVVLSACETAVGESFLTDPKQEEGIEINALSFYFISGGAKTVMASLWQVDDASTSQLMQRFYCTLAKNPSLTKAEALRKAKMSLLNNTSLDCESSASNNTDFTHPYYWSPFILIGNGL
ncbi:MAG: CHAT domain-containing protein [Xenococcaceae cyanobacterium MO_188.B32]|nr:CHAT domain-containing protein [Xenococcaceae cyanobacterium MO_188.B32]